MKSLLSIVFAVVSYLPTLLGNEQPRDHDWIFTRSGGPITRSALITRDGWKLIQHMDNSFQLYNILKDPGEYNNVEAQHPEIVQNLVSIYEAEHNSTRPDLIE